MMLAYVTSMTAMVRGDLREVFANRTPFSIHRTRIELVTGRLRL
jgi:hypothetical protein